MTKEALARRSDDVVSSVRAFNRFYTRQVGVLEEGLLKTRFSLAEARVLYELANRKQPTATELATDLGLDPGYLSRILTRFKGLGFVSRRPSQSDARQSLLALSAKGAAEFDKLNTRSNREIEQMLAPLSPTERGELTAAMAAIERLLGPGAAATEPFLLRQHRAGDMGTVIERHATLYAQEHGFDHSFEALIAKICSEFLENFDPSREHCWIAERGGRVVGSVFLVKQSEDVAKLRLLFVESKARGLGIGNRLVEECVRFARERRYKKITLWTQSILFSARRIYERNGFSVVRSQPNREFGRDLISETWELNL